MSTYTEILAGQTFFSGLPPETLEAIGAICADIEFERDDWVLREGDPADVFYVLTGGRVALEINAPTRPALTIETLGPGDVVGLSWILPDHQWTFDARAVETSPAVAVDAIRLRAMCDDDPKLGYALYRRFSGLIRSRLQATRVQLLDLYGRET